MTHPREKELETELEKINFKNLNQENYSLKSHRKKKGKGKRSYSPWWFLQNRVMNRYYHRDSMIDFSVLDTQKFKLQMKKKDVVT